MTINFDKLDEAVQFIVDHPEKHDQKVWTCETGACLAGWGALLNGYSLSLNLDHNDWGTWVIDAQGRRHTAFDVALNIFGLTMDQAWMLFDGSNTIDDIQRIVKDFHNEVNQ